MISAPKHIWNTLFNDGNNTKIIYHQKKKKQESENSSGRETSKLLTEEGYKKWENMISF